MNRINNIKAYAKRKEAKEVFELKKEQSQIDMYVKRIKNLKSRIAELISTANACLENGIEINKEYTKMDSYYDKWELGTFCTNCITHKIGFVWQYKDNKFINRIETMGIDGGGANGEHYLRTDGNFVVSRIGGGYNDSCQKLNLYQLIQFVETFDDFETAFYKYVDEITNA